MWMSLYTCSMTFVLPTPGSRTLPKLRYGKDEHLCYQEMSELQKEKKINVSNLETRSVIQDVWPHRHPHWELHTLFWHFCREKDKTWVVSRSLDVSCPPPGHCMTPGGRKARRGWPTAPSTQDTFCFLWLQSLRNRTTHHLNSFYHRAVSITNPLKRPPACSHNLWTALFFFKHKAEPLWCLSLQVIFITKLDLVRPSEGKWKELKVTFCTLSV